MPDKFIGIYLNTASAFLNGMLAATAVLKPQESQDAGTMLEEHKQRPMKSGYLVEKASRDS